MYVYICVCTRACVNVCRHVYIVYKQHIYKCEACACVCMTSRGRVHAHRLDHVLAWYEINALLLSTLALK